jgi:transcriptional regulator with XRE-family HTH domain
MNTRIKQIREKENLTQEEFGERIGSARNTIANYETGNRKPSNAVILSICREFGINEEWLRTGSGEMKKEIPNKFSFYLGQIEGGNDEFIKDLIEVYMELDTDSKQALRIISEKMAEKIKNRE